MNTKHELLNISKGFILGIAVILSMSAIAWNGPVSSPPNYNAYAPINISAASQTKSGALWAGSFLTEGGGYFGGNVGIGTSNPGAKLSIVDSASYGSGITAFGAGDVFEIHNEGTNDSFKVDDSTSDATPFVINNDGKVGVGTPSPVAKLHVEGSIKATGGYAGIFFPICFRNRCHPTPESACGEAGGGLTCRMAWDSSGEQISCATALNFPANAHSYVECQ